MSEPNFRPPDHCTSVSYRGRKLAFFGGCDFFRLSFHSDIRAAVTAGVVQHGLNVAASRCTTGNHPLYRELERALEKFFGAEAAVAVSTGYGASVVAAQAMAGEFSHALLDERAHVALQAAARELHCPVRKFRHRDVADLALRVRECGARARPILLTDGMFGHDGSVAPVREYLTVLPRAGWLLVDDAYAAGTIGRRGQGTIEYAGVSRKRIIQCVTLSKAFGVYGGAVLGPKSLPDRIFSRSSMFIGSTPLPLPLINAALVAVGIMRRSADMRRRLAANTARVREGIRAAGWTLPEHPGPIVALPPQSPGCTRQLTRALRAAGVFPSLLRYPGGPAAGYFRFVVSSEHTRPQLDALIAALCAVRAPAG